MVWSQYVYEATTGLDTYASDDDEINDNTPLNIHDWEVEYSDELTMLWNLTRTLLEDATLTHSGDYWDFVDFCFQEHNNSMTRVTWEYQEQTQYYEERLSHTWNNIRRCVIDNGLYEEILRGTSFYDFVGFAKNIIRIY
ncbi:hypothetical protein FK873_gp051 [Micromonas pusilla virus SP1]|jgi:hypothetical protein|uniref:Uncharacterized protein n=1 Tax=Micromonas pusilla virus SP1 TaxID=373996 RepID=G9E622_MPSP1|nr:hypothetical protein FK873_gp051 [Micromonas pusilla virus SP1]AET84849.1 hypothetical protein MPXG_00051 [Micromonas pusilla virus SP1]